MDLKSILKAIKLNESTISMVLGALVIIVVGILVINLFGNNKPGQTIPPVGTEQKQDSLPTNHIVQKGEDLWKISEHYYGTGYNWTDIAAANNMTNANQLRVGENITIPNVTPRFPKGTPTIAVATPSIKPTATATPTVKPTPTTTAKPTGSLNGNGASTVNTGTEGMKPITGNTYTVVHGDNLWDIAVRAYGNGYKWVDIARANHLADPDLIHSGNVFTLPR